MRRIYIRGLQSALQFILLIMLASCAHTDSEPTLAVSVEPYRKILQEIVGDNYKVITVLGNGANPETYDPTVAERMATDRASAFFITGYLPFEHTIASTLNNNTAIVDTSVGILPITGTHSHGDEDHSSVDPHIWTSLRNGHRIADNMLRAMVKIDPDNAEDYRQRHARLTHRLDSLDAVLASRISDASVHAFMVWHPSLSYYARDYGLHQISVGQESKEHTIANLRDIIEEAREDSVKVFFFQQEYDSRQARGINDEIGSRLVTINPLDYEWEQQLIDITDALTH